MQLVASLCFAWLVIALGSNIRADEPSLPLTTLDSKISTASLSAINRDTLVAWGAPTEWVDGPVVMLVDGSILAQPQRNRHATLDGERLKLTNSALGPLELPIEWVAGVIVRLPVDVQLRDRLWRECLSPGDEDRKHDLIQLDNGDRITGAIQSWSETPEGRRIEIKTNVGAVPLDVTRVAVVRFDPSLLVKPKPHEPSTLIGLDDGTRLVVRDWQLLDERVQLTPAIAASTTKSTWSVPRESVVFVQPLGGKVRYLADLSVEGYRHVPYLSVSWPYELDRNVMGTQLRSGGRLFAKGVGMHSTARLTFTLDKPYRRFDAQLAIDDHTAGRGSVVCRVFVDSEQRYTSPAIQGGAKPISVTVDVRGGQRVSLIVDFGDGGDTLDRVNWLDARVIE